MIFDKILGFLVALITAVMDLMPDWTEPFAVNAYTHIIAPLGTHVHQIKWFDVPLLISLVGLTVVIYGATTLYTAIIWVYGKLPGKAT